GHPDVVEYLIERGAYVDATTGDGATPLHIAAYMGHYAVVKILVERGANVNARSFEDVTPLHNAANRGYLNIVKYLVEHGAKPNVRTKSGNTPLHFAALNGHADIVKLLLEHGADPNIRNNDGKTPLDLARENGHHDVVEILEGSRASDSSHQPVVSKEKASGPTGRTGAQAVEAGHRSLINEPLCRMIEELQSSLEQYVEYVERIAAQIAENEMEDLRRRLEPFTSKLEGVIAALRDSVEGEDRRVAKELDDTLKEARNVQSLLKSGIPSTAELVRLLANMKARIVIVRSRCR
ncbi:ankyrin repeat domain-containing protein, partial [Pyrobaculum sp.]|uniref:ankyrin repeat domain-containing protein n=1 Tax=Pyrobaculum sp. TaxID=2004705 RepID=UPI003D14B802